MTIENYERINWFIVEGGCQGHVLGVFETYFIFI